MASDERGVFRGISAARNGEVSKEKMVKINIDERLRRLKSFEAIWKGIDHLQLRDVLCVQVNYSLGCMPVYKGMKDKMNFDYSLNQREYLGKYVFYLGMNERA